MRGFRWRRPRRQPSAFSDPIRFQLSYARDRKQTLRNSAAYCLVHGPVLKRHRNRSGFVRAGIVEFPFRHNGDRDQVGFAVRRKFKKSDRARPFTDGALGILRLNHVYEDDGQKQQDDAPAHPAV